MSSSFETVASFEDLLSTLSIAQLQAHITRHPALRNNVHRYLRSRKDEVVKRFFTNVEEFWEELTSVDGVISGSSALSFVLPRWRAGWEAKDLDLFIPRHHKEPIIAFLAREGYDVASVSADTYGDLEEQAINQITHLRNVEKTIDIIESSTASAIAPIFRFHSSLVMNFFNAQACFCAYPQMTTNHRALINCGRLADYRPGHRSRLMRCWKKYEERGFRFAQVSNVTLTQSWRLTVPVLEETEPDQRHICKEDFSCPHTVRATTDEGSLLVYFDEGGDNHTRPPSRDAMFWHLGGAPCRGGGYGTLRPFASIVNINIP
ncbi:hypothetical protein BJ138DRAFT_1014513 [Hygrophoropsis aurantiaca]|uniref:Uncharacterized protein n=1 Tax=Hygrophoropsis aurantiaca TaxID=72124 RepID=A0ACB8A358_9AGAM|nr:hypothetical protein BJ138DRAFT_1014513 [Hygrophoropsis aurantiaca]